MEGSSEVKGDSGLEKNKAEMLRFDVSKEAHVYGKSKTETLSSILTEEPSKWVLSSAQPDNSHRIDESELVRLQGVYQTRRLKGEGQFSPNVPPYAKDHARIVHSPAYRRLEGKSQLIPSGEGEFFRTRLTHSQEVAEIGVRIARHITGNSLLPNWPLDFDLITCACLLHDIGHPPFGHSGEEVLNEEMKDHGGFEGNAQTLHLITQLENRLGQKNSVQSANANPRGLNLTLGVLASILKYDRPIPKEVNRKANGEAVVHKGYYESDSNIVKDLKNELGISLEDEMLKTIECQIMDIADDIAYSVYDLEDTMEAGIINPLDFFSVDDKTLRSIAAVINKSKKYDLQVTERHILDKLSEVFSPILQDADTDTPYKLSDSTNSGLPIDPMLLRNRRVFVGRTYNEAILHAKNPLIRRQYLETLIQESVESVRVVHYHERPFLSKLALAPEIQFRIDCMKLFNYFKVISSRQLRVFHHRSKQILKYLFDSLSNDGGGELLHEHDRESLARCKRNEPQRMRLVANIIANLTDRDAVRLYLKLNPIGEYSMFGI